MKIIKRCSDLLNSVCDFVTTLVKSAMPWRRDKYHVQLSEQKFQSDDKVLPTRIYKDEYNVKLSKQKFQYEQSPSYRILDNYAARAKRAFQMDHKPTAPYNSEKSTNWSERYSLKGSNTSWEEMLQKEGTAVDERDVTHTVV